MRRFLLWDYRRGSWQYDIIVILILAFIFLTPRSIFRDQPRTSKIVLLPTEGGSTVLWIEPDLLADVPEEDRSKKASELLHKQTGRRYDLTRLEAIYDEEKDLRGFMAFVKP